MTPDPSALATRLHAALALARRSGDLLMRHFRHLSGYQHKDNAIDLVSDADRESDAYLAGALAARFPGDLRILEEADGRSGAARKRGEIDAAEFAWCVDPLDGTTNFVHGYPSFAVSIGLLHRGRPVLGVVHAPALGETFVGGVGVPATLNHAPIRVSAVPAIERALLATGFAYDRREKVDELLAVVRRALLTVHDLRRAGSAALDLCNVAAGRLDGYFERGLSPWDVAAGHAIVEAAGGATSAYDGGPHDPFASNTLASNGLIHPALIALVRG